MVLNNDFDNEKIISTNNDFSNDEIIPARIKKARISRGFSLADLENLIGVSKQFISQCELGTANASSIIYKLTEILNYPLNFFLKPVKNNSTASAAYFRSRKSTPKKLKDAAIEKVDIFDEIKQYFENYINYPKLNLPNVEVKEEYTLKDIEEIARSVREYWNIGMGPINNIVALLQENGIIISRMKVRNNKIDAFSQWLSGTPYIFLSIEKDCAVRSRFDIAHELCHILLHQYISSDDIDKKTKLDKIEKEADAFAGAFLLPAESFSREVFSSSLDNFVMLKKRWKVSISCMIRRCADLNILTENQIVYLKKQMTYKNYWRKEPLDNEIPCEEPYLFNQIVDILLDNNCVSASQIVDSIGLSNSEIEEYCYLEKGKLKDKNQNIISIKDWTKK